MLVKQSHLARVVIHHQGIKAELAQLDEAAQLGHGMQRALTTLKKDTQQQQQQQQQHLLLPTQAT
jgi:hypothetical protein